MKHSDNRGMWLRRFSETDKEYGAGLEKLLGLEIPKVDLIHQFPLFAGHVNIARYLAIYESFKMVQGICGHYADVGTWKGSSFLFIAKLIKLFETYSTFQVHAFDWFKGMDSGKEDADGNYRGNYELLINLVQIQGLSPIAVVHEIDLMNELADFEKDPVYASLHYKYVFMDCGHKDVLEKALPFFWNRLLTGGIMLFDHFGSDIKEETEIVKSVLPKRSVIRTFPFTRQPTGYVLKC